MYKDYAHWRANETPDCGNFFARIISALPGIIITAILWLGVVSVLDWFKNRLVTKEDKDNAVNETKIDAIIISLGKLNTKIDELKADMQIQDNGLGTRITEQGKILNERIDQVETKLNSADGSSGK
ncbi:hypothetical protein HC766_01975 [Candidatus Gracilibacteria bacterium]|nr:hypothetical protein [Candidatus Gracilibacteria bacterium]